MRSNCFRKFHGNIEILLIKHVNSGHWSFPKGHVEKNETELETAHREIMEETGIDVILDPTFRETVSYSPKKDTQKVVVYFLAKAKNFDFKAQEEEISEIRWVDIGYAVNILTYDNDKVIVNKAKSAIKEENKKRSLKAVFFIQSPNEIPRSLAVITSWPVRRNELGFTRYILQLVGGYLSADLSYCSSVFFLQDKSRGVNAELCSEYPVICAGTAASKHVSRNADSCFKTCFCLYLGGYSVGSRYDSGLRSF